MALGVESTVGKGKRSVMYVCSCPFNFCKGTPDKSGRFKFHGSVESVRSCQKAWLTKQGYKQVGRREWQDPSTGRILVLSKKPARAKPGKQGRYMGKTTKVVSW